MQDRRLHHFAFLPLLQLHLLRAFDAAFFTLFFSLAVFLKLRLAKKVKNAIVTLFLSSTVLVLVLDPNLVLDSLCPILLCRARAHSGLNEKKLHSRRRRRRLLGSIGRGWRCIHSSDRHALYTHDSFGLLECYIDIGIY